MSDHPPPATFDELERYLPYLVNRLSILGQQAQNRMLEASGINLVHLRTLSVLNIEGGLTINEIAARTFTEQSSTSRAIDAMVAQGLVERRIPEKDQRRREIILTPLGHKQLLESWPAIEGYFEVLCTGTTPAERDTCRAVLARMLENLSRLRA